MAMLNNEIIELSLVDLLDGKDQYCIPIYQRNYAWEAKEIEQLIQDIIDYSIHHHNKPYYIGTLVVSESEQDSAKYFNTIDGQQRLTTLTILSSVIKNRHSEIDLSWFKNLNLKYESREKSLISMKAVFDGTIIEKIDKETEINIKSAYDICDNELIKKTEEYGISISTFCKYLYKFVKILRVPLPKGIDLNHYFEIMNSRGEQLEKHEVLKARLMSSFNILENKGKINEYHTCFNLIWESCANMEKYVQYGFSTTQRHIIFGQENWNYLSVYSFDEITQKLKETILQTTQDEDLTIEKILVKNASILKVNEDESNPDKFNSVINFQNFLLHVLRVQTADKEVALDDKRLIEIFDLMLPKDDNERLEFTKEFIYNLLKCKFLFDKYVIKRKFTGNDSSWSLSSLKWYNKGRVKNGVQYNNTFGEENNETFDGDNRRVIMLLSMFHVSIPSMSYKYWLNASLNYLFHQLDIDGKNYIHYLEHTAKRFVFDNYLAIIPNKDYFDLINNNLVPIKREFATINVSKTRYKEIENNLVFNFLDYLLWSKLKNTNIDGRVKSYEYSFRSSVEHYYPQTPMSDEIKRLDYESLHSFGNLCLVSNDKNSRLSNYSPKAKTEHYGISANIDSVKQYLMMQYGNWTKDEIENHEEFVLNVFKENLNSEYKASSELSLAKKWFKEYQIKDKNLLIRALLCFGDCSRSISDLKFYLFDFEFIKENDSFRKFEEYIINNEPRSLSEIIQVKLKEQIVKVDYTYLFIKHPEVINYCQEGKFQWFEETDGRLVNLLKSERNSIYNANELISFIIKLHFKKMYNIDFYCDNEFLYIGIGFENEKYFISQDRNDTLLNLCIWNNEGVSINGFIEKRDNINGNYKFIKLLEDYKWQKDSNGNFERFGNSKLVSLGENFEENELNSIEAIIKLLKNGFGIKLSVKSAK